MRHTTVETTKSVTTDTNSGRRRTWKQSKSSAVLFLFFVLRPWFSLLIFMPWLVNCKGNELSIGTLFLWRWLHVSCRWATGEQPHNVLQYCAEVYKNDDTVMCKVDFGCNVQRQRVCETPVSKNHHRMSIETYASESPCRLSPRCSSSSSFFISPKNESLQEG